MKHLLIILALISPLLAITPEQLIVVYNKNLPESQQLAETYAQKRNIPTTQLVPLHIPTENEVSVSRDEYNRLIRDPLIKAFDTNKWWIRQNDGKNGLQAAQNKIRGAVLLRGIPYKIDHPQAKPELTEEEQAAQKANGKKPKRFPTQNNASVDSELVLLSVNHERYSGPIPNPYFRSKEPFAKTPFTPLLLIGRIDGPTWEICHRLIDDAIATEKEGLWGWSYVDLAYKRGGYVIGDEWLNHLIQVNQIEGIPTIVERTKDCYLGGYPMNDCATYYGWYAHHVSGPFKDPEFRFKKGAVAVHLHSFSASDLRNSKKRWVGPLLTQGAAATVGNVWEPLLGATHHLGLLHDRLVEGHTLLEAGYMSMPVISWMGVVIGDPLYRPFAAFKKNPPMDKDKAFKAYRMATLQWGEKNNDEKTAKLRSAAARMNSSTLYEAVGLEKLLAKDDQTAAAFFNSAKSAATNPDDALRQTLHQIAILRQHKKKPEALQLIQAAKKEHPGKNAQTILNSLQVILDPPPPPPVVPDPPKK